GNCASSFVQGLTFYRSASPDETIPGLMNPLIGRYHIADIEIACAFDINANKVGRDLSEALLAEPNNTRTFADMANLGVPVERGRTLDGLGVYLRDEIEESSRPESNVTEILRRTRT